MKTYNSYEEAKIAMPDACIIEDTDYGLFFGMPGREGTTLAGGSRFAEPQYYCMTVEKFLADGHKFVEGDFYLNSNGSSVGKVRYPRDSNKPDCTLDHKLYVLSAAALENQMNIDNLATQTPEEKEALDLIDTTPHQYEMSKFSDEPEWKNGDELDWLTPDNKWCMCEHLFIGKHSSGSPVIEHKTTGNMFETYWCAIRKPETPQQREERERLEAVKEMFTYWSDDKGDFVAGDDDDRWVKELLFSLHDAGYKRAEL